MHSLPILAQQHSGLTVTELFNVMVGAISEEKICKQKPTGVTYSSVFVVDLLHISRTSKQMIFGGKHGRKPWGIYH